MKGGLGKMLKQVQEMQANMQKMQQQMQEELASLEITGQAGGGMVTVVMNGRHEARRVSIDPTLLGEEKDMLEDLIAAAINDAAHKVEEVSQEKISSMAAGLGIPAGLKLPF